MCGSICDRRASPASSVTSAGRRTAMRGLARRARPPRKWSMGSGDAQLRRREEALDVGARHDVPPRVVDGAHRRMQRQAACARPATLAKRCATTCPDRRRRTPRLVPGPRIAAAKPGATSTSSSRIVHAVSRGRPRSRSHAVRCESQHPTSAPLRTSKSNVRLPKRSRHQASISCSGRVRPSKPTRSNGTAASPSCAAMWRRRSVAESRLMRTSMAGEGPVWRAPRACDAPVSPAM